MKALKTKSLYAAVIAGLGAAGSMQAGAVNISLDNSGQVLLYPYYTTRGGFVTSLSVVNTDQDHTKVAKVRFLEGKNSAEVLDFNLFLSPRDVWTAAVVDNGTGGSVFSTDRSCTAPALPTGTPGQPFVNFYYTGQVAGTTDDNAGGTLDRTREGYVEIIEMGVVANAADAQATPATPVGNTVANAVKHASNGTPANCNVVRVNGLFPGADDLRPPAGGLNGNGIIINSATGVEYAFTPVALGNFFVPDGVVVLANADLYTDPGNLLPDLRNVSPARSDVFRDDVGGAGAVVSVDWVAAGGAAIDAISALFIRSSINNEYDVSTGFRTDWVITAPTKRFYVFPGGAAANPLTVGPFFQGFTGAAASGAARSCDNVFPSAYDREEAPYAAVAGVVFSPVPIGAPTGVGTLCWESTVLTVVPNGGTAAAASIFSSVNSATLTLPTNGAAGAAPQYTAGWISLIPTRGAAAVTVGPGQVAAAGTNAITGIPIVTVTNDATGGIRNLVAGGNRYRGLPVIGFAAIQGIVGTQGYGGLFAHKHTRNIAP